jgi:hypothetical protein
VGDKIKESMIGRTHWVLGREEKNGDTLHRRMILIK